MCPRRWECTLEKGRTVTAIDFNWNPSNRQLQLFGLVSIAALPTMGWLFAGPSLVDSWQPFHLWLVGSLTATGILLAVTACWAPRYVRPIFLAAALAALPIGLVIGEIALIAIFVFVFTPMGIVFRLVGRDPLQRRIDRKRASYWTEKEPARDVESYFRQS